MAIVYWEIAIAVASGEDRAEVMWPGIDNAVCEVRRIEIVQGSAFDVSVSASIVTCGIGVA